MPLHVSSTCAHRQEVKLYYTASGIITPIGGRPVHRLREEYNFDFLTMSTCARNM